MFVGFFENFQRIIVNVKQELVIIRNSNHKDALISVKEYEDRKIEITKIS